MTPQQEEVFFDDAKYLLLYGGRASGKSFVALHKAVKHAYENSNALVMVCTLTRAGSTAGGAWEDLLSLAEDHTGEPAGILEIWRKGINLEYTEEYGDKAGNKYIDVRSTDGGVSRIMQMSLPAGSIVTNRIKTFKPSFFLFEELTNTYDSAYFYKVIQQLGRRRGVPQKLQQYCATCNPPDDGPDHWVHKAFIDEPFDVVDGNRVKDPRYSVHCLNPAQNPFMEDKEEYLKSVEQEARLDPTAYDRLILGKWVARVVGCGIFENFYDPNLHVKGELGKSGLKVVPYEDDSSLPVIVGYDPGDVNNARLFLQRHNFGNRKVYTVIDESVKIKERRSLELLTRDIMDKMVLINKKAGTALQYIHIGDKQGWDQYNNQGDLTYKRMYEISLHMVQTEDRYKELSPIWMKAPEKGAGSKEERVRLVRDKLLTNDILVSGTCGFTDSMFRKLREDPKKPDVPLKTPSGEIHTFDALSYPILFYEQYDRPKHNMSDKKLEIVSISA
tara:strand:+ start:14244 stop:15746 length:1503 start_codon:yes stop_codon:yes gene_type:complete